MGSPHEDEKKVNHETCRSCPLASVLSQATTGVAGAHSEPGDLVTRSIDLFQDSWASNPQILVGNLPQSLDGSLGSNSNTGSAEFTRTLWDINAAMAQWNGVANVDLSITRVPGQDVGLSAFCRANTIVIKSETRYRPTTAAETFLCFNNLGNITGAIIEVNTLSSNWHNGGGTPGSGEWDFRSIITHEIGHALGAVHYDSENANQCDRGTSKNATMCDADTVDRITALRGTTWMRSLAYADRRAYQQSDN